MQVRTLLESKHALEVRIAEIGTRLETSEKELEEKIQVKYLHLSALSSAVNGLSLMLLLF